MRKTIRPADEKRLAGSRDFGIEIRTQILDALRDLELKGVVVVDLEGLDDMTPSFADECFGKLSERLQTDVRTVIELTHAEPFQDLINAVIRVRLQRKRTQPSKTNAG